MVAIAVQGSATGLPFPDESIDCIITSPPYNCEVPYDGYVDHILWEDYYELAKAASREMYRVLVSGGRIWINVPPSLPTDRAASQRVSPSNIWMHALAQCGPQIAFRDQIVWRQDSHDGACAWGSWKKPSAPNLRGCWEVILNWYKSPYKRTAPKGMEDYEDGYTGTGGQSYDLGGDWTDLVRNVWDLKPERGSKYGPAPFPLELPARCIRLSTWPGEIVLDPFGGSGTTAKAADMLYRVGISVDISAGQTRAAADRLFTLFS